MLLPDGTTIDDTQAAQLVQLVKDEWAARAATYTTGGTRWRDAKTAGSVIGLGTNDYMEIVNMMKRVSTENVPTYEVATKHKKKVQLLLQSTYEGKEEKAWKVRVKRRANNTFDVVGYRWEDVPEPEPESKDVSVDAAHPTAGPVQESNDAAA